MDEEKDKAIDEAIHGPGFLGEEVASPERGCMALNEIMPGALAEVTEIRLGNLRRRILFSTKAYCNMGASFESVAWAKSSSKDCQTVCMGNP